ncbi:thioredoxin-dependent thiol peroxidase [Hwanghaeella grinnelliae]|uniref:thioredoxin-dependent peroxiredoxin n=1 Tax=Hwanghaeella grinnelliae TaxID=2500179 RepID=A0A3S2WAP8_9PROT|nr:thioredoxin-dependent thiol peroxidase [Hwanghaeella grinnelliae]RVU38068.1 thioredoxin-dependent thiol peroxidase [Hwanghaeella grinnelliae]
MALQEGDTAPNFTLPTDGGGSVTLADLKGSPVVVYFYPKDNTPGCTTEAKDFRDLKGDFDKIGATIIGISKDSVKKHDNFKAKQELNFALASDEGSDVCEKFGAWGVKKMYGKEFEGIIRSTYLIGPDGKVAKAWPKVKVNGHAQEVLDAAKTL